MIKKAIIIFVLITLAIAGVLLVLNYLSYKSVNFVLKDTGYTISIYAKDSSSKIKELTNSGNFKLKEGSYYYVAMGSYIDKKQADFKVNGNDNTVTIDPSYSVNHLAELAQSEWPSVKTLLEQRYKKVLKFYTLSELTLHEKGEWGTGYIVQDVDSRQAPDVYRYVVQKTNNQWTFIATPQLTISKFDYPTIPNEVLVSINGPVEN